MATFFPVSLTPVINTDGTRESGALAYFYLTGTTDDATVYQDSALGSAHAQPVEADADGVFPDVYLDDGVTYRCVIRNADDTTTYLDIDPINPTQTTIATLSATLNQAITASNAAQTAADTASAALETIQTQSADTYVAKSGDTLTGSLNVVVTDGGAADLAAYGNTITRVTAARYSSDANGVAFQCIKARGTYAAPTVVASNDTLGGILWRAYDGAAFRSPGTLNVNIVAATPSSTDMQARLICSLAAAGSSSASEIFRFGHASGFSMFGANPVIDQDRGFQLRSRTVTELGSLTPTAGRMFFCSNESGGAVPVFGDGTNWKRVTDRATMS